MRDASLRILIYDENHIRASILEEGLRESGLEQIAVVTELNGIVARIAEFDPQVIFLDITISRFNAFNRLTSELDEVRTELADRKIIDQAKLLLMKRCGINENEACLKAFPPSRAAALLPQTA